MQNKEFIIRITGCLLEIHRQESSQFWNAHPAFALLYNVTPFVAIHSTPMCQAQYLQLKHNRKHKLINFFYSLSPRAYSLVKRDKSNDHTSKYKTATLAMLRKAGTWCECVKKEDLTYLGRSGKAFLRKRGLSRDPS